MKLALRLAALALVTLCLLPVQIAATRWRWGLRLTIPALYHRAALRIAGVKVTVQGAPSARRPLLIVANHVSWLDIAVIGSRFPLSFVAKAEVAGWPVVGLLARLQRSVFIDRARRQKTGEAAAAIGTRLRDGDPIVLFAEGTTGDGIHLLPFRSALIGAAEAAAGGDEAVLVQPLAIRYMRRDGMPVGRSDMPSLAWVGDTDLAPHARALLAGGPIDVTLAWGEAVATAGTDRKALARRLQAEVARLLGRG